MRERRLKPGPGNPRAEVERNQRERLYGALVAAVDELGLERTSVAEVATRAGVSRGVVYEYFDGRPGLFAATYEALMTTGMARVARAHHEAAGSWEDKVRAAMVEAFAVMVAQPAAARLCMLDSYAAGPRVEPIRERVQAEGLAMIRAALDCSPPRRGLPDEVLEAIAGGIRTIVQARLRRRTEGELLGMVDELVRWIAAYERPPVPLTATPAPPRDSSFVATSHPERIFVAMARTIAAQGYAGTAVADVASAASVSLTTFYEHFRDKEDAFLATCDFGIDQAFTAARQAWERAQSDGWPAQVRAGMGELLEFLAAEPEWSNAAMVEIFAAGPRARARRDRTIELFTTLVEPGRALAPSVGPVTVEALGGAVYSLMYRQIRVHGAGRLGEILPAAVFVLLTPFVGAAAAADHATAG